MSKGCGRWVCLKWWRANTGIEHIAIGWLRRRDWKKKEDELSKERAGEVWWEGDGM